MEQILVQDIMSATAATNESLPRLLVEIRTRLAQTSPSISAMSGNQSAKACKQRLNRERLNARP